MHSALISADEVRTKLDHDDWAIVDTRFYLPEPERGKAEHLDTFWLNLSEIVGWEWT